MSSRGNGKKLFLCPVLDLVPVSFQIYKHIFHISTFFPWRSASHSNEPDRVQRQRFAEAPGGRAFRRRDDRPHQPGVHPGPGGADRAAGTTEEEDSAGGGGATWSILLLCCVICEVSISEKQTHLSSAVYEQVIHNWTIPLHGERSDQILLTKTFEMLSRYSQHCMTLCWFEQVDFNMHTGFFKLSPTGL